MRQVFNPDVASIFDIEKCKYNSTSIQNSEFVNFFSPILQMNDFSTFKITAE